MSDSGRAPEKREPLAPIRPAVKRRQASAAASTSASAAGPQRQTGSMEPPISASASTSSSASNMLSPLIGAGQSVPSSPRPDSVTQMPAAAAAQVSSPFGNLSGAASPMTAASRAERFKGDDSRIRERFRTLREEREENRKQLIKAGVMSNPDKAQELDDAKKFKGTCRDMCPEFERVEREMDKELDALERVPGTSQCDPRRAVKKYRRAAAGKEASLPEDIRPPEVLKQTLDYLLHELLPSSPFDPTFNQIQAFTWDRTRAIRQDFTVQSDSDPIAIECHERIARYHIFTLHFRGGLVQADGSITETPLNPDGTQAENLWSEQQELEQLRKTIRSLLEMYADRRLQSRQPELPASPNEAEFHAYNLLLHLRDPETQREVESLPEAVFGHAAVQSALVLRSLAQKSNNIERRGQPRNEEATLNWYSRFFRQIRSPATSYLQACLAENIFHEVRMGGLKALSRSLIEQYAAPTADWLTDAFGFDDAAQLHTWLEAAGIEEDEERSVSGLKAYRIYKQAKILEDKIVKPFSFKLVESKRGQTASQTVVDGPLGTVSGPTLSPAAPAFVPSVPRAAGATPVKSSPAVPAQSFTAPKPAASAFSRPVAPTAAAPAAGAAPAFPVASFSGPISYRPAQPKDLHKPVSFAAKQSSGQETPFPAAAAPSASASFSSTIAFEPRASSSGSQFSKPISFAAKPTSSQTAAQPSTASFGDSVSVVPGPSAFNTTMTFSRAQAAGAESSAPSSRTEQVARMPSAFPSAITSAPRVPEGRIEHRPVEVLTSAEVKRSAPRASKGPAPSPAPRPSVAPPVAAIDDKVIEYSQAPAPAPSKETLPESAVNQFLRRMATRLFALMSEEVTKEQARTIAFEAERVGAKTLQWRNIVALEQERMHALRDLLIDTVTQTIARQCALEASATAFREMRLAELALGHWLKRTAVRKEWHRIRARSLQIEERRTKALAEIAEKEIEARPSPRPAKPPTDINDELVSDAYVRMLCQRDMFWLEGSWSHIIFEAFSTLFPIYKEVWPDRMEILLSFVDRGGKTQSGRDTFRLWLQSVFDQTTYEIPESENKTLQITTFERFRKTPFPPPGERGPEVPLLIFECGDPNGKDTWEEARTRLAAIHASLERRAKHSRTKMVPKLLVLCWLANRPDLYHTVLSNLQIKPSMWPQLACLALDKADITTPFVSVMSRLLNCLSWDRSAHEEQTLLALCKPLRELFTTTLNSCEAYLSSLMKQTTDSHQQASHIWRMSTSLGNLLLRFLCVVSRSEYPEDEPLQVQIVQCGSDGSLASSLDQLYQAALDTLTGATQAGIPNLELLTEELRNYMHLRFIFPLSQVVEELFTAAINLLETSWRGRRADTDEQVRENIKTFASMCDRIADEAAGAASSALPKYAPIELVAKRKPSASTTKRRRSSRTDEDDTQSSPEEKRKRRKSVPDAEAAPPASASAKHGSGASHQASTAVQAAPTQKGSNALIDRLLSAMNQSRDIMSKGV